MTKGLALFNGILYSLMILMNGLLAESYGNYYSTILVHLFGLIAIIVCMKIKKKRLFPKEVFPLLLYTGGAIGVLTVVFNNIAFSALGVTATLGLGLLGQSVTSLVIDQWGLLGAEKVPFKKKKLIGIAIILAGIAVMLFL
ncbi:MAG: DMT family transporter [Lachnospiraceae bacterium]|nr:DMT family transporter [Lachnospiraceae bacterium]